MVLNTTKERVCVNQIIGQKVENILVEGDMIVPDIKPDILKIIGSSGNVCIYKKEVLEGKIRIDGSVNVYIAYVADSENSEVRSLNTCLDFTSVIDFIGAKPGMSLDENICVKTINCRIINERKIGIEAVLEANIKVYSNEEIEVINEISDIPNLQMLESLLEINSLLGTGDTKVYAKDTMNIDPIDDLAEILKVDVKIINKDTKVSYNKILVKADAEVKVMYLTEDNRINSAIHRIPVMGFIDMPNVNDNNICDTRYKLKNLVVKPNSVEEHSIYAELEIEIIGFVYESKSVRVIQDLYSPNKSINFTQKNVETRVYKETVMDSFMLREKFMLDEPNDKIYDTEAKLNIISSHVQNGMVNYELELRLEYLYLSMSSNQLQSKSMAFTINHSVSLPSTDRNIVETNIEMQNVSVIILPDTSAELSANISFELITYKDESINIIDEINYEENNKIRSCSLVIYYVKTGDSIWNIAKEFNSTMDAIISINNLDGADVLSPGRQLFIPRYVEKR